jgi:hypothetical protein
MVDRVRRNGWQGYSPPRYCTWNACAEIGQGRASHAKFEGLQKSNRVSSRMGKGKIGDPDCLLILRRGSSWEEACFSGS